MNHERTDGQGESLEPQDPGEWIDKTSLDILARLESSKTALESLTHDNSRKRLQLKRLVETEEARLENLGMIREQIGSDYGAGSLRAIAEVYEQQSASQRAVNAGADALSEHSSPTEQFRIDNISARRNAATEDTLCLLAYFTAYLETKS